MSTSEAIGRLLLVGLCLIVAGVVGVSIAGRFNRTDRFKLPEKICGSVMLVGALVMFSAMFVTGG